MKYNILGSGLLFGITLLFGSCEEETEYSAPLSRFEVEGVTAVAGDESVALQWTPQSGKPIPDYYLISWQSGSADGEDNSVEVDGKNTSYQVLNLKNDVSYTFSVQAHYPSGLAQKKNVTSTPKTTRIPVSEFKATAGDRCVLLSWIEPVTGLPYSYKVDVTAGNTLIKTLDASQGSRSLLVQNLDNDTEYAFSITVVYGHGNSITLSSKAIPGHITAISCLPENPKVFERCKLEYNPAYFMQGTIVSVQWSVDDTPISFAEILETVFTHSGKNKVTVEVTFADGTKSSGSIDVNVDNFSWTEFANAGYQKASNFAFSHDGQTLYTISQSTKTLYAVDAITGQEKWQQTFPAATYGAGIAVGTDGKIYLGTEDKNGTLYAYSENGTLRWSVSMGAAVKAAPAVTSDGYVYALCDGARLISYNSENGSERWSAQLSGNAGGVAVDADGNVYAGTSVGVWSYTSEGARRWESESLKVTERGGSLALDIKNNMVYAVLKGKEGIAALDMGSGVTRWKHNSDYNDCYHPVVDGEGNVYFNEKGGALYCLTPQGSLKWKYADNLGYTYSGFAIGKNGHAYITQYASPFAILGFDSAGGVSILSNCAQTMSPVCIGPDGRLYYGLNGSVGIYNLGVQPLREGWYCRGGNLQGTNSFR